MIEFRLEVHYASLVSFPRANNWFSPSFSRCLFWHFVASTILKISFRGVQLKARVAIKVKEEMFSWITSGARKSCHRSQCEISTAD